MYIAIVAFHRRLVEEARQQLELAERAESVLRTPNFSKYLHLEDQVNRLSIELERANGMLQAFEPIGDAQASQQLHHKEQLLDQAVRKRKEIERRLNSVCDTYLLLENYTLTY